MSGEEELLGSGGKLPSYLQLIYLSTIRGGQGVVL